MQRSHGGFVKRSQANAWRSSQTVTNPAATNTVVATSERGDRRETPHTPWPLVQPAP